MEKIPTSADWDFHGYIPSARGIVVSHKIKWSEIPYKFLQYAEDKTEWKKVLDLLPKNSLAPKTIQKEINNRGLPYEIHKYVLPILHDLNDLSVNEESSREFEKKVNLLFRMLGFEVNELGQGSGRNPDGVAKENQFRYAIIIDSKSRSEEYKIGTEDRKFIEYIKKYSEVLSKSGFNKIYLLIVSSRFNFISKKSLDNIKIETNVTTTLITSNLLLKILAKKIEEPRLFSLKEFQQLFIESGEISQNAVDKFLSFK